MTAFSKADFTSDEGTFCLEILSVNKKGLEISLSVPKGMSRLEAVLRKWMSRHCSRGTIQLKLYKDPSQSHEMLVDQETLSNFIKECHQLAFEVGMTAELSLQWCIEQASKLKSPINEVDDDWMKLLEKAFSGLVEKWNQMRQEEGNRLKEDILLIIQSIEQCIQSIEPKLEDEPKRFREKLLKRVEQYKLNELIDEERIAREVVLYAEKVDVNEEIVRLKSHIKEMHNLIESSDGPKGRKSEFLLQEMFRETNSLGVKCHDLAIVNQVLMIKSQLEKIREQVQNVE